MTTARCSLKTAEEDKEVIQEATASSAATKAISMDAAVLEVLGQVGGFLASKEEEKKLSMLEKMFSTLLPSGFCKSLVKHFGATQLT